MRTRKSPAERAFDVLAHERFFELSVAHQGHMGSCPKPPVHMTGISSCYFHRCGFKNDRHGVSWVYGNTGPEAVEKAAQVLLDGVPVEQIPGSDP